MATVRQNKYYEALGKSGCLLTNGDKVVLHFFKGDKLIFNKANIAPWLVIPLCYRLAGVSSTCLLNIRYHTDGFHDQFGDEYELIMQAIELIKNDNPENAPPDYIIDLIRRYYNQAESE